MHINRDKVQKSVLKTKKGNKKKNIFSLFRKLSLKIPEVVKTDTVFAGV